ncbi:toxin glutamine deamidase domain-containing protein [Nonomuraea sp. SYSU D8015]|uniref:toxin glutamine deamidase domain-containing protein n=1 Tax=Nonomuraea sp. SYSU D8015 TaxID=2593644 RepID=UPI0016610254|nr:toxin glutamine deamidase domain-containing protein [Nonomuraea sp. SYSU D8015]
MFRERKPSVRWVLPEGQYNPVVGDGVRWLDYERAAERDTASVQDRGAPDATTTLEPLDVPEPVDAPDRGRSGDAAPPAGSSPAPLSEDDSAALASERWFDVLDAPAERVAEGDWFDWPHRPPRLAECRPYGVPGGLAHPDPQAERDLIEALPPGSRFPDPRGTWIRLINGGGPADDPFRSSNAADCALAVLSTWHGEPATAAPRMPEYDRIGRPLLTGERGSTARIERWVGQRLEYAGQGRHAYPMIARRLLEAGHGAGAVLVVRWPGGGTHAWNAVNADGEVIWIDAQRGHMSVEPPYTTVTGVFCVILDRQGRPR